MTYSEWLFERQCQGKVRYVDRRSARLARKRFKASGRVLKSGHLQAYFCEFCDRWHLGNLDPAIARGERESWRVTEGIE